MRVRDYVGLPPEAIRVFVAVDTAGERWDAEFELLKTAPLWHPFKLRRQVRNERLAWDEYQAAVEAMKNHIEGKYDAYAE